MIPQTRTYYKPYAAYGQPVTSISCGYQRTKLDALKKNFDGYSVTMKAIKNDNGSSVDLYISTKVEDSDLKIRNISVDTNAIKVTVPEKNSNLIRGNYFLHQNVKGGSTWSTQNMTLQNAPFDRIIEVTLLPGTLKIGQQSSEKMVFRFSLTTTFDILYFSINC